ncbi:hypothetical protein [Nonomuraea endophytica]
MTRDATLGLKLEFAHVDGGTGCWRVGPTDESSLLTSLGRAGFVRVSAS